MATAIVAILAIVIYTALWKTYKAMLSSKRHQTVGKEINLTRYVERFNRALRQRRSRLVRPALPFLNELDNHTGAIWNVIHYYNDQIRLELLRG